MVKFEEMSNEDEDDESDKHLEARDRIYLFCRIVFQTVTKKINPNEVIERMTSSIQFVQIGILSI